MSSESAREAANECCSRPAAFWAEIIDRHMQPERDAAEKMAKASEAFLHAVLTYDVASTSIADLREALAAWRKTQEKKG